MCIEICVQAPPRRLSFFGLPVATQHIARLPRAIKDPKAAILNSLILHGLRTPIFFDLQRTFKTTCGLFTKGKGVYPLRPDLELWPASTIGKRISVPQATRKPEIYM